MLLHAIQKDVILYSEKCAKHVHTGQTDRDELEVELTGEVMAIFWSDLS